MKLFEEIDARLLPDFRREKVTVRDGGIQAVIAGSGPPLLMLHGDPQTHLCWHRIAPALTKDFTVILTDLRGRGESHKPGPSPNNSAYSKRIHAAEQVAVMEALGFDRFRLVGHDRGARVARRMALDHPEKIERLVIMDIVPALDFYEQTNSQIAQDYFYFFFLTQPYPLPDNLIKGDPEAFIGHILKSLSNKTFYDSDALKAYIASAASPASVVAMCECFRAALSHDIHHDRSDLAAGRKIVCPTLVMWGQQGVVGRHFDMQEVWSDWAPDCRLTPMLCGHFIPEEAPSDALKELKRFL